VTLRALIEDELRSLDGLDAAIFDIHSHTGVDVDGTVRTAAEHLDALAAVGGRSAIFPLCVTDGYEPENRRVVAECEGSAGVLVPFARLDPRTSGAADAEAALAAGARGFKLHPRAEDFRLEHPNVDAIAGIAAEARVPVLIHAGVGVGSLGSPIVELAERHRECPLILAHAAVSDLVWLGPVAAEHPNVYFDTSWWNPSDLLALFALVPPGQILFGSDEPYMDLELVLAISLRCARFAGLDDDALRIVFGGQAETLLSGGASLDAGPTPGPAGGALSPLEERLAVLLAGAGGAMLGGGDPSRMLELAQVAVGSGDPTGPGGAGAEISALIDEARGGSPDAPWAMAMALTLALTSGARSAAFSI
jgi:predicted TIM-barrel fold metal-dependent hydrolase